jgi:predicted acyl esterase
MRGYELMVSGEILRGRYRTSFAKAAPITPNAVLAYTVDLHQQSYTFRKGHRLMVQVQSTWFPLYDRNPQRFVPNIFTAKASDYTVQTHTVHHARGHASRLDVTVLR